MRLPLVTASWRLLRLLPAPAAYRLVHSTPTPLATAAARLEGRPPGVDGGPFRVAPLGVSLPNLLGVAAGFDKDARLVWVAWALGAGFHVVGSVLPRPHRGARVKLVARLPGGGTLNRLGLPSEGAARVAARLASTPRPPGMGLAASVAALEPEGYPAAASRVSLHVDWVEVNVSCPNTREHRSFEEPGLAREACRAAARASARPVLLKIPPPGSRDDAWAYADAARECGAAGVVASNTLRVRLPGGLEAGLGGPRLYPITLRAVAWLRERLPSSMAVVAVGGVATPGRAVRLLEEGADLVEAASALLTRGPRAFAEIARATAMWASRRA